MSYKSRLLFCCLMSLTPFARGSPAAIEISVAGISPCRGNLMLAVYSNPGDFMKSDRAVFRQRTDLATVECGSAIRYRFDAPFGQYAAVVYHDANGNGTHDKNAFGAPTEAWGVSNNARPFLRQPRFDECVFIHAVPLTSVAIEVR